MLRILPIELFLFMVALFVAACLNVWVRTATVTEAYEYVQREKEYRGLQQQLQKKRVAWLRLTSPKKLESIAKRLQLIPPSRGQRLRYSAGKGARSVGQP